jgi:hypothetical protein
MAGGNALHDLALDGFVGNLSDRPMTNRTPAVLGVRTGQGHNLTPLFGGKGRGAAAPGGVLEPGAHIGFAQTRLSAVAPALFPGTDGIFAEMQMACDLAGAVSLVRQENDEGAQDQGVFFAAVVDQGLQGTALDVSDFDRNRFGSGHLQALFFQEGYLDDCPMSSVSAGLPPYTGLPCTSFMDLFRQRGSPRPIPRNPFAC